LALIIKSIKSIELRILLAHILNMAGVKE